MTPLETALELLAAGLWPVPITPIDSDGPSPGKRPIGEDWGKQRHTPESLRDAYATHPGAGIGLRLGPEAGIIDIEVEDREHGEDTLTLLLNGEDVQTMGWDSERGPHRVFRWDDRLARYGKAILKGDAVPGLEIRLGCGGQFQSVCPPSPSISGRRREWNGVRKIAPLPEIAFEHLDKLFLESPSPRPAFVSSGGTDVEERARRYLAKLPEAVEGQRGHDRLYHAACVLVDDFALSYQQALPILREWNESKALPPETEKQVQHKLTDAVKNCPRSGKLLNGNGAAHQIYSGTARAKEGSASPDDPWESPVLEEALRAEAFPIGVFPVGLQEFVSEGSRCLTCPVDFLAMAVLAIAGATIGRSLVIGIKDSWIESSALYAAFIGKPGSSKSPPLALAARPLWAITEELLQGYKLDMACLKKDDPKPVLRRIAVNDTTCEALAPILAENPRGVVMVRDELTAWVAGLNQYKSGGKGSDRQFFLSAWSGASVTVDRKSHQDRTPIHIPHPFLSVVGAMTPEMLCELSDAKNRDDGFIDRLLFSFPDSIRIRWNDGVVAPEVLDGWHRAIRTLWNRAMFTDDRGRPRPFFVRFTPEALSAYAAWFDAHCEETEELDFPRHLEGPWSKMRAYCARLALILDQLERAYDPTQDDRPLDVGLGATRGAIRLSGYFKNHCRRVRALLRGVSDENADARAILKWVRNSDRKAFSERDAKHNFPGRFGDEGPELDRALAWLRARSCIRPMAPAKKQGAGRPKSPVYEVNPSLLECG